MSVREWLEKRKTIILKEPLVKKLGSSSAERVVGGLYIVVKGHPPAGEKLKLVWYGFNEKEAIAHPPVSSLWSWRTSSWPEPREPRHASRASLPLESWTWFSHRKEYIN